ncbi:MAG: transcriptional regulator [Nitrososphaerota archaeon]|nr:hypothetical protein [Nitrososphaerales archaeon]MDW8045463.1 transcriptional regulator [Nitrososphaerota archaeon]
MHKDQVIGVLILIGSIIGIVIYGLLIYYWPLIVLQITAFLALAVLLGIVAWIGWTMATTPPPAPLETELKTEATTASEEKKEGQPS